MKLRQTSGVIIFALGCYAFAMGFPHLAGLGLSIGFIMVMHR